jgi:hypothetical protein
MIYDLDIPVPDAKPGRKLSYEFDGMPLNASFTRPLDEATQLRNAAKYHKNQHPGWDYVTRREGRVIRLWCTSTPTEKENADVV